MNKLSLGVLLDIKSNRNVDSTEQQPANWQIISHVELKQWIIGQVCLTSQLSHLCIQ